MQNSNNEIDITKLIVSFISFVKKKKQLVGILSLIGFGLGLVNLFTNTQRVYEKSFVIQSSIVNNEIVQEIINSINAKLGTKTKESLEGLSKEMDLPVSCINELKGISFKKQVAIGEFFWIIIEVSNKHKINEIAKGIQYYVNKNEYVKLNLEYLKKQKKELIAEIEKQIKLIDSSLEHGEVQNFYRSTTSKYFTYIDLFEGKQRTENELLLRTEIKLIDTNTPLKPKSKLTSYIMVIGDAFIGFFLGIFIAFFSTALKKK